MEKIKNKKSTIVLTIAAIAIIIISPSAASASTVQWDIQVSNLSGSSVTVSYDQLLAMPQTNVNALLTCYGNFVADGDWSGVRISDLFNAAGFNLSSANSVIFTASDEYMVTIPISYAMRPDVIIAHQNNGASLPEMLRLVIPQSNGDVWISSIIAISLSPNNADNPLSMGSSPTSQVADPRGLSQSMNNDANFKQVQEQKPPQPTPTPTNTTVSLPQPSPENVTPTPQAPAEAPAEQTIAFPIELIYAIVLGVVVAVVALSFGTYRRTKR